MLQIASMYEKMGKTYKQKEVLEELLQLSDQQWQQTLELPFLSRKFQLMKQLKTDREIPSLILELNRISAASPNLVKRKEALAKAITDYLQSRP